jgi:ribosomal protein S18 acetylase RimI-like enzyme
MPELVLVTAKDCLPLRRSVLRPKQPKRACLYENDDHQDTVHYAMKQDDEVLGIVSIFRDLRGEVGSEMWRVRGLAVSPEAQGDGLGNTLMRTVQAIVTKRGGGLWANVRTSAGGFYEGHGFQVQGDPFSIKGLGPHTVMTWRPEP